MNRIIKLILLLFLIIFLELSFKLVKADVDSMNTKGVVNEVETTKPVGYSGQPVMNVTQNSNTQETQAIPQLIVQQIQGGIQDISKKIINLRQQIIRSLPSFKPSISSQAPKQITEQGIPETTREVPVITVPKTTTTTFVSQLSSITALQKSVHLSKVLLIHFKKFVQHVSYQMNSSWHRIFHLLFRI